MNASLRVLIVEDSPDDAAAIEARLRRCHRDAAATRVDTPEALSQALDRQEFDLVVADYAMPGFSGLDALAMVRKRGIDVPLIVVSGAVGEEIAVAAMRAGAHDYMMKDNLSRLCPAVERELRQVQRRREARAQEAALRESERRFRSLFENNHSVMLLIAPETGQIVDANPAACAFYGYDLDSLTKMSITEINTLPQPEVFARMEQARAEGRGHFNFSHRLAGGATREVEVYSGPVPVQGKQYLLSIIFDVTEGNEARRALEESEERYRTLFQRTVNPVLVADGEGNYIDCNEAACRFLEAPREEILTRDVRDLAPPPDQTDLLERYMTVWKTGGTVECEYSVNGQVKTAEFTVTPSVREGRPVCYGIGQDVTERRRAEEQRRKLEVKVQQAQKLESLGVLAGGIAHDFNNLLMGVLGYADMALTDLAPESPARECIEQIEISARRAADLARQMLAYSGKGRFMVQFLDLSRLVDEMAHLLSVSVSKKAVLKYDFEPDLPPIEGDATQIRQIVMNLITNASDAIGEKPGVIAIGTGAMHCDKDYLRTTFVDDDLPQGLYIYLEVSDTGCGMDDRTRQKVFDPFFTTKFTGRGLGLAAVLGIVRGHHGAVKVYSEPGKGTSFKVLFPVSEDSMKERAPEREERAKWTGIGTVLVADDEETVRNLVRAMLERMGFRVLTAADGRECVGVYRENRDKIDLVILDMTMPHMSGEEAFCEMRRIKEDVRVVLSSGYNEQDATSRFAGKGLAGFIQKPYQMRVLREKLRQILPGQAGLRAED